MTTTSDDALLQCHEARGVGPQSENFDLFIRIDAGLFDHHARGDVRWGAETADAQGFALEGFQRFELRLSDQRHWPIVEKAGDDSYRQAGNGTAGQGAEELAIGQTSCCTGRD